MPCHLLRVCAGCQCPLPPSPQCLETEPRFLLLLSSLGFLPEILKSLGSGLGGRVYLTFTCVLGEDHLEGGFYLKLVELGERWKS